MQVSLAHCGISRATIQKLYHTHAINETVTSCRCASARIRPSTRPQVRCSRVEGRNGGKITNAKPNERNEKKRRHAPTSIVMHKSPSQCVVIPIDFERGILPLHVLVSEHQQIVFYSVYGKKRSNSLNPKTGDTSVSFSYSPLLPPITPAQHAQTSKRTSRGMTCK